MSDDAALRDFSIGADDAPTYGEQMFITRAAVADGALDVEAFLADSVRRGAEDSGYTPIEGTEVVVIKDPNDPEQVAVVTGDMPPDMLIAYTTVKCEPTS